MEFINGFLKQQGYEQDLIIESGLAIENKGRVYDRFRNRIIFPIIDYRIGLLALAAGF